MSKKNPANKEPIDVLIPTFDNLEQLVHCVQTMFQTRGQYPLRFIIVNNGNHPVSEYLKGKADCLIINPGKNLGWTGGIAEGLKYSKSKYVMFSNDDVFVPVGQVYWLSKLVRHLEIKSVVAAVGPVTNCAMGSQNIFLNRNSITWVAPYLIGFCVLVRRSALDEVGGIDETFNTGDDIDMSIRFTKAGYYMMVDSTVFVYHHGFQTGEKVYGGPSTPGGWNSQKMTDDTNIHLIQKHGFLEWWYLRTGYPADYKWKPIVGFASEDQMVQKHVNGCVPSRIAELGCGGKKTVPESIGIDRIPRGDLVVDNGTLSCADVVADVEKELPFEANSFELIIARHILEHCTDTVGALEEWKRVLSDDGRMIISVPDERIMDTIMLNPEHVHAFTPDSLGKLASRCGFKVDAVEEFYCYDSFTMVLSKDNQRNFPDSSRVLDLTASAL